MTPVVLRIGRNLPSLEYTSDISDRWTRIRAKCGTLGGEPTYLGYARWPVTANASGVLTLADPAGGHGPVGFDDQFDTGDYYIYREKTAQLYLITASTESPNRVTIAGDPGIALGEFVQFRRGATAGTTIAVGVAGILSSFSRGYIVPLLATGIASTVLTLASYIGTPAQPSADGQYVGDDAAFSNFVQTSHGDFTTSGDVDTWPHFIVTHVSGTNFSGLAVGDWCITGDLSVWEGGGGSGTSFPPMTVTAVNSSTEIELEIRGNGPPFRQGAPDVPLQFFRPIAGNLTGVVTASSASAHTLTVDDATSIVATSGAPLAIELSYTPAVGQLPYFLDHPIYVAPSAPGIGVKVGTIDRQNLIAVSNLSPNAFARGWSAGLPVGYTASAGVTMTQNTDPLYTEFGGSSILVTPTPSAAWEFRTPIIYWRAAFAGQRFSLRAHILIAGRWSGTTTMSMRLGFVTEAGTVYTWNTPDPVFFMVPPDHPTAPSDWGRPQAGAWFDAFLNGFDITAASNLIVQQVGPQNAVGFCIVFVGETGGVPPFYFDAHMVTPSAAAPDRISEFGDANRAHQDTNTALSLFAPRQISFAVNFFDLKRLNPSLTDADVVKSAPALMNGPEFAVYNVAQRLTEVTRNINVKGDTRIISAPKSRRFSRLFVQSSQATASRISRQVAAVQSATTGTGGSPGGTSGGAGLPQIQLHIAIDDAGIPTITVVGDASITSVKIATSTSTFPTPTDVRAATAIDSPDPFVLVGSALSDGDTIKVAAFGYTASNVESGEATGSATYSAPAVPPSPVDYIPIIAHQAMSDWENMGLSGSNPWSYVTNAFRSGTKGGLQVVTTTANWIMPRYLPDATYTSPLGVAGLWDLNGVTLTNTYVPLYWFDTDDGAGFGSDEPIIIAVRSSDRKVVALKASPSVYTGTYDYPITVLGVSTTALPASGEFHLEVHPKSDATTGYVKVWLDQTQILNATNVDTQGGAGTRVWRVGVGYGPYIGPSDTVGGSPMKIPAGIRFGEMQLLDLSTLASDDDFQGILNTDDRVPVSDSATYTSGTAHGAANKWDCVNDVYTSAPSPLQTVLGTDYIEMAADGDRYTAGFSTISGTRVHGVTAYYNYRHSQSTGTKAFKVSVYSGGTLVDDSRKVIVSTFYGSNGMMYEGGPPNPVTISLNTDPATSAAWGTNVSAFNSAEFGFKQEAATSGNNAAANVRMTMMQITVSYRP